jgi:predicted N-formylglutamate amidohydrolase
MDLFWNDALTETRFKMTELLSAGEAPAATIQNENGSSPIILICEHASNTIPKNLGMLGLSDADLQRHIAYDIGALGTSKLLSKLLNAPLIYQNYSRLIYDCNRSPESDGAVPEVSEITPIPANKNLNAESKLARINEIYRPFQNIITQFLDIRAAKGLRAIPVSIHSSQKFTRVRNVTLNLDCYLTAMLTLPIR